MFALILMAVAGGATSAYKCVLTGALLHRAPLGMVQRSQCAKPEEAARLLQQGETVTVAGSDMVKVEALLGFNWKAIGT